MWLIAVKVLIMLCVIKFQKLRLSSSRATLKEQHKCPVTLLYIVLVLETCASFVQRWTQSCSESTWLLQQFTYAHL